MNNTITNDFPYPIAKVYLKTINAEEPIEKFTMIGYLFEITLKYATAISIAQYLKSNQRDETINRILSGINRPSLGKWAEFLRETLKHNLNNNDSLLSGNYFKKSTDYKKMILAVNKMNEQLNPEKPQVISTLSPEYFSNTFVSYRNKTKGHGAIQKADCQKINDILLDAVEEYILSFEEFVKYTPVYISRIEIGKDKNYYFTLQKLNSTNIVRSSYSSPTIEESIVAEHICLTTNSENGLLPILSLHPIFIFIEDKEEIYVLNEGESSKIEYLCYHRGGKDAIYSPDELKEDFTEKFGDIIKEEKKGVPLVSGVEIAKEMGTDNESEKTIDVEENNKSDEMSPSITFWHFIMFRDTEQLKAFENKNWLLCLIEYGEDWRTNMLDQVQPNDVIFLFRRGGYGYIGAFRAKGKKIYTSEEWYELDEDKRKEIALYDMYNAFEDGATSVANVLVEPIAYNFKGVEYYTVRRRTIERMNDMEAVKFLLNRFNGKDLDNDRLDGKGKLDNNTNIENLINKNYFSEIISKYNNIEKTTEETQQEAVDIDKKEVQTYFWTELIKQLKNKGYDSIWSSEERTIEQDVEKYYAKARNRHRWFGFSIEVYTAQSGRKVGFYVELDNEYCYGFAWMDDPVSDDELSELVKQVAPEYESNPAWAGQRYPDYSNEATRHDIDFWRMNPETHTSVKRLIDPSKREELIKEIAQEMDEQIKKFIEIAKENNL